MCRYATEDERVNAEVNVDETRARMEDMSFDFSFGAAPAPATTAAGALHCALSVVMLPESVSGAYSGYCCIDSSGCMSVWMGWCLATAYSWRETMCCSNLLVYAHGGSFACICTMLLQCSCNSGNQRMVFRLHQRGFLLLYVVFDRSLRACMCIVDDYSSRECVSVLSTLPCPADNTSTAVKSDDDMEFTFGGTPSSSDSGTKTNGVWLRPRPRSWWGQTRETSIHVCMLHLCSLDDDGPCITPITNRGFCTTPSAHVRLSLATTVLF